MDQFPDKSRRYDRVLTDLSGFQLLTDPLLNKGTAFTEGERSAFGLHGLLPPHVGTLFEQMNRRLKVLRAFETDLERYAFLRDLQDTNETLFFALLVENLEELMPIVYTPTVGAGCEQFSRIFRKPRGIYLSPAHSDRIDAIFSHPRFDSIEAIVVTDGERILGLGDQGAGGMGIPIGKLALYTGCGGLNPRTTLPIMLDLGTDNGERILDPLYIGWRHERIRGDHYDAFIDRFVQSVRRRWPQVLLQWEDFAKDNATRLLEKYRDQLCTFNDDVQGTAAVATGTLLAAINVTGIPVTQQQIVIVGAGSAGCGIAKLIVQTMTEAGLSAEAAAKRIFLIDRAGLLLRGMAHPSSFQVPFLQPADIAANWHVADMNRPSLEEVVRHVQPTVLIGVSGQPGAFSEGLIRMMADQHERPIIFPLSNPTSRSEATPADIDNWSGGRAIIGTGSPFPPLMRNGAAFKVDQTNNSYIFPGVGLGAISVGAKRISDSMFMAAAKALAEASPTRNDPTGNLLPPISAMRAVALQIAIAVAHQASVEKLTDVPILDIPERIASKMWSPDYLPYERAL